MNIQSECSISALHNNTAKYVAHGGGKVVSVLAFNSNDPSSNPAETTVIPGPWWWSSGHHLYSDNPSSNPTEPNSFSVKFVLEKNENKQ